MSNDKNPSVIAAWITGGLGCAGVILLVIGSIVAAVIQKKNPTSTEFNSPPVVVILPTSPPASTPVIAPTPATTLRVINNTSADLCNLFIVPTGSETWGEDWLKAGESIQPNKARTFTMKTGMYHLLAENCEAEEVAQSLDNHIEGDMHWVVQKVPSESSETVLKVINNGTADICNFYIAASASDNWGDDWLDQNEVISAGESLTFSLETGMYDLLAEDCNEESIAESDDNHLQGNMQWIIK